MTIRKMVETIEATYPEERVKKIQSRLNSLWKGKSFVDRIPWVIGRRSKPKGQEWGSMAFYTLEERLNAQLSDMVEKSYIDDDYIPAFITDDSPYALADAFGCKGAFMDRLFLAKPLILKPEDVYNLEKPNLDQPRGWIKGVFDAIGYFQEKTEGKIPFHLGDIQAPLATAATILKDEHLFCAMYTNPKEIHYLLQMVTETIIDYISKYIELIGGEHLIPIHCMPYTWKEPGSGTALSDDLLAVISPDLYKEYALPYIKKISESFGNLVVHSCGDCSGTMKILFEQKYIEGVHLSQTSIDEIARIVPKDLILLSQNVFSSRENLSQYVKVVKENDLKIYLQVEGIGNEMGIGTGFENMAEYIEKLVHL